MPRYIIKESFWKVDFKIQSFCSINEYFLICGDIKGKLIIIDIKTGHPMVLNISHDSIVTEIRQDLHGNIWSAGKDGKLYVFPINSLL